MPLTRKECFEILGLPESASEQEIKSAYKKLALKTHPDKNPGDPDANKKFLQVSEAYKRISDPDSFKDEDDEAMPDEEEMAAMFKTVFAEMFGGMGGTFGDIPMDMFEMMMNEFADEDDEEEYDDADGDGGAYAERKMAGIGDFMAAMMMDSMIDSDDEDEEDGMHSNMHGMSESAFETLVMHELMNGSMGGMIGGSGPGMRQSKGKKGSSARGSKSTSSSKKCKSKKTSGGIRDEDAEEWETDESEDVKLKSKSKKTVGLKLNSKVKTSRSGSQHSDYFDTNDDDDEDDEMMMAMMMAAAMGGGGGGGRRGGRSGARGGGSLDSDMLMAMMAMGGMDGIDDMMGFGGDDDDFDEDGSSPSSKTEKNRKKAAKKKAAAKRKKSEGAPEPAAMRDAGIVTSSLEGDAVRASEQTSSSRPGKAGKQGNMQATEDRAMADMISSILESEGGLLHKAAVRGSDSSKATGSSVTAGAVPASSSVPSGDMPYQVGDRVLVNDRDRGVVAFCGTVHYTKGVYVGVIMNDPSAGKNNGIIKGVQYFTCAAGRGLMVRPVDVKRA